MPENKRNFIPLTIVLIVAVLILTIFLLYPKLYSKNSSATITTQGSAQIKVMPDSVVVMLYTQINNKSAEDAKNINAEIIDKITTALIKIGLSKEDIETEQYSIYPNYNWRDEKQEITGYQLTQTIKVTTNDFDKTGKIVDAAVNEGALVSYINFDLSQNKQNEFKVQLLADASKDARTKADAIAQGLGKKITNIASVITNDYNYYPYPLYAGAESGVALKEAVTQINPKQLDLNAQVSVTFNIK